jgi:hypothetical protein
MIRSFMSGGVLVVALAAPCFAQEQCVAPKTPVIPDGAKATPNQIIATQNEINAFAAASDNFQNCLVQAFARRKAAAAQNNAEIDPGLQTTVQVKSAAQRMMHSRWQPPGAPLWKPSTKHRNANGLRRQHLQWAVAVMQAAVRGAWAGIRAG